MPVVDMTAYTCKTERRRHRLELLWVGRIWNHRQDSNSFLAETGRACGFEVEIAGRPYARVGRGQIGGAGWCGG